MADIIVPIGGWSRFGWGEMPWGQTDLPRAVGNTGSVTVVAEANVPATGLEATGSVGTVTVQAAADVSVTGTSATAVTGNPAPFTAYNQAQLSTAQAKFGVSSLRTDGSLDRIENDDPCNFGSGDYTVEFYTYRTVNGAGNQWLFDNRTGVNSGNLIYVDSLGRVGAVIDGGVSGSASPTAIATGAWHHIALVRSGSTYKFFVNGTAVNNNFQPNTTDYSGRTYTIGSGIFSTPGAFSYNGWTDEVRISTVARYSANFTPPSFAFTSDSSTEVLLHFDGTNGSTTIVNDATANTVTVFGDANAFPAGVSATGAVGSVTVTGTAVVDVTGVSGTSAVGSVVAQGSANAPVTGVSATGAVGSVTASGTANAYPSGIAATGSVGTVAVISAANVAVVGVSATGQVGQIATSQSIEVYPTGVSGTGQVGSAAAQAAASASVIGVSATGQVGTVTVAAGANAYLVGVFATGGTSTPLVWGQIVPNQNPSYSSIEPSQSAGYATITPSQSSGYVSVAPSQSPGYAPATPSQSPDWKEIAA